MYFYIGRYANGYAPVSNYSLRSEILNRIEIANNYKKYGSVEGGGYIWHTTGSGKTLTSYKVARNLLQIPAIQKTIFVVDRRDLDQQTTSSFLPTPLMMS